MRSGASERASATHGPGAPGWLRRLPKTRAALAYARQLHQGQRRKADGAPFIAHPIEVAGLLHQTGAPDHLIAAGVLHDVIEKTEADAAELTLRFGSPIAALVLAVSEDEQIARYADRKAALRTQVAAAGREALMLFAADKISKARELRLQTTQTRSPPAHASRTPARRVAHYRDCLRLLEERAPDSPLTNKLRTELEKAARIGQSQSPVHGTHSVGGHQ